MSIIDQLEKTVTPAVLGEHDGKDSVAYVSLLEQFYAILAARLALPQVYSQLLRADQTIVSDSVAETTLFKQLWTAHDMQQLIIQELATTHHIDVSTTEHLLLNSAPLAYHEFKVLANGQFLPAFLQAEQTALRMYLPIWSAAVINAPQDSDKQPVSSIADTSAVPVSPALVSAMPVSDMLVTKSPSNISLDKPDESSAETSPIIVSTSADIGDATTENNDRQESDDGFGINTDAIHANPSAHHLAENSSNPRGKVRTRSQRNDLLVKAVLLIVAIMALALAAWAILIRPNNLPPVEPVAPEPVVVAPAAPVEVMTPIELIVGMDNSGGLFSCSAIVGDEALQSTLQQALNTSFGEQASNCELTVQKGVANSMANLPTEMLPNIFNMLRAVPFASLKLQNDRLTLAAPDSTLLQRLVMDIRTLAPAMTVDSTAPLPLPDNVNTENMNGDNVNDDNVNGDNINANDGMAGMNEMGNLPENINTVPNNQYNNGAPEEFQAPDDNTDDRVLPVPNPNSFNNNNRNTPNNAQTNNQSSGRISESELDDLAGTAFIAEPAQVRR